MSLMVLFGVNTQHVEILKRAKYFAMIQLPKSAMRRHHLFLNVHFDGHVLPASVTRVKLDFIRV